MLNQIPTPPYFQTTNCINVGCEHKGNPKNYVYNNQVLNNTLLGTLEALAFTEYDTEYKHFTHDQLWGVNTDSTRVLYKSLEWDNPIAATQEVITRALNNNATIMSALATTAYFVKTYVAENPAHKKWLTECEQNTIEYIYNITINLIRNPNFIPPTDFYVKGNY